MTMMIVDAWNRFFHGRIGPRGLKTLGWMRIAFASLVLADRLCTAYDLIFLLSPEVGVLPYRVAIQHPEWTPSMWSLFQLAPESELWLWVLYALGVYHAVLLILGVSPRFHAICLFVNILSFNNHNVMIWDQEDAMFRVWAFFFLLMPLDHVTILDGFGRHKDSIPSTASWSMWPVRLFQIDVALIYCSASLCKMDCSNWRDGTALYHIAYGSNFYPGVFNPDILFDRLLPIKIMTWTALAAESTGWICVWIPKLRLPAVLMMVGFHVGIDLTMNMYCFEWLAIVGWCAFLVQPEKEEETSDMVETANIETRDDGKDVNDPKQFVTRGGKWQRWGANLLLAILVPVFFLDTLAVNQLYRLMPDLVKSYAREVVSVHYRVKMEIQPFLAMTGLGQGVQTMYACVGDDYGPLNWNCYYQATLTFEDETKTMYESFDWLAMPWWERKARTRLMNYFDTGAGDSAGSSWVEYAKYLHRVYSEDNKSVSQVSMRMRCEEGLDYDKEVGWWEPLRQPYEIYFQPMLDLNNCNDIYEQCLEWKEKGWCETDATRMKIYCQKTCGICSDFIVTWPNEALALSHAKENDLSKDMFEQHAPPDRFVDEEKPHDEL